MTTHYAARHPQCGDRLRQLWPGLRLLANLGRSGDPADLSVSSACEASGLVDGTLGDFRIVREIGRGGMGVVYEAEQISLGRRVALKVLPFAAMLDERQLQRFKNEARAAAGLHHTNIVPVFSVGSERGVHFYAMQYIEGQTLAEILHDLRGPHGPRSRLTEEFFSGRFDPDQRRREALGPMPAGAPAPRPPADDPENGVPGSSPSLTPVGSAPAAALSTEPSHRSRAYLRSAAHLGVQIAEALDYAHSLGVIHRDVKPANLLLDTRGNAWITDFGLARMQTDAGLTLSGDIIGTLRYMSPEQALGRSGGVDHRSDIYALGATLYELLTLHPAVAGDDHQEILHHIAFEEPKRPRKLNRSLPADLEMIVLKALDRDPARRYATAQDLADDLRRFLAGLPVQARPAGLVTRVRLWCRHPERVRDAGAFLLFQNVVLIVWCLSGLTAVLLGLLQPERPLQFAWHLLQMIGVFYVPLIGLGIGAKRRKLWAIWGGTVLSLLYLSANVAYVLTRFADLGGVYNERDPGTWFATQSLIIILGSIQSALCGLALLAYYSNRKTRRRIPANA